MERKVGDVLVGTADEMTDGPTIPEGETPQATSTASVILSSAVSVFIPLEIFWGNAHSLYSPNS